MDQSRIIEKSTKYGEILKNNLYFIMLIFVPYDFESITPTKKSVRLLFEWNFDNT